MVKSAHVGNQLHNFTGRSSFPDVTPLPEIAGQLNPAEREILMRAILDGPTPPQVVLEVGTWLGGGSTLHLLRALEQNGEGHLWGIEADRSIYEAMLANIGSAAPAALPRFTPLFGLSHAVIPTWLKEQSSQFTVDLVFLDGGDNPLEQITEFRLLCDRIPVGGQLLSHDAKLRKGRWLVPYVSALDNWSSELHDVSEEGLFQARKLRPQPSPSSRARAQRALLRLQLNPTEVLGRILPRHANRMLLRFLPQSLVRRITQGRRSW